MSARLESRSEANTPEPSSTTQQTVNHYEEENSFTSSEEEVGRLEEEAEEMAEKKAEEKEHEEAGMASTDIMNQHSAMNGHALNSEEEKDQGKATNGLRYIKHLTATFEALTVSLAEEQKHLKSHHFKEYTRLGDLTSVLQETDHACKEYGQATSKLAWQMAKIREILTSVRATIDKKLGDEGLYSWLTEPLINPSDLEKTSEQKSLLAEAAEARSAVARAKVDLIKAEEGAATLHQEAAETSEDAIKAQREVDAARRALEATRKAEEEKRQAEEKARQKAEAEKRKKEEEEQKRKEAAEKQKRERAKLAGSPEEQERMRLEAERTDPKNWPMFVYSVDPGELDIPVGCVFRALPNTVSRDEIDVERLEQLDGALELEDNEELVSHIIRIFPTREGLDLQGEEPYALAVPHCAPRNPAREAVVKLQQKDGSWKQLETKDVTFEDIRDFKFVEVRLRCLGTVAVVTRFRREEITLTKRGGKFGPAVDSRITFNLKANTVRFNTPMICEVQPVELTAVSDLKLRQREMCESLMASSPFISLDMRATLRPTKPVTVSLPVPPPPAKPRRPGTASGTERQRDRHSRQASRPKSAFLIGISHKEDEEKDIVHLLQKDVNGKWIAVPDIIISQSKNKDIATFEMETFMSKFCILRTKEDVSDDHVAKIVTSLESSLTKRHAQIILRQNNEDAREIVIQCVPLARSERYQRKLSDEGYDSGPPPSPELVLTEGQHMYMNFRGNIQDQESGNHLRFVFNTHIKTRIEFSVAEIDHFAQKGIDCYRGFAQVFTTGLVQKEVPLDPEKDKPPSSSSSSSQKKGVPTKTVMVEGEVLLCEMLINLPKPEVEPARPISRAPLQIKAQGLVGDEMLRGLASELGEEWRKLAHYLSVRRGRIQAIMRNNVNEPEKIIYDMLLTWAKKVPHSMNKVDILCRALTKSGRLDLVIDIREREREFQEERAKLSRAAYLRKAFIKVAQNAHVTSDWKYLARELGLSETELEEIEGSTLGMREKCIQGLMKWQEKLNGEATIDILAKHLRRCRYHNVAEQVKAVG